MRGSQVGSGGRKDDKNGHHQSRLAEIGCAAAEVGTVGALVGATDLADAEDVERSCVECPDEKAFRFVRFEDDGLTGTGQVGDRKVTPDCVLETALLLWDVIEIPVRFPRTL